MFSKLTFTFAILSLTSAIVVPRTPTGTQFITGPCKSDADCASGCCGFNSGLCAGAIIALTRDGGCGHGATPNDNAAKALGFTGTFTPGGGAAKAAATPAPAKGGSGKPPGTQFITGPCGGDGDCASGCCGFNSGLCAGPVIALTRDGGCGHGNATPNDNAAKALGFTGTFTPGSSSGGGGAAKAAATPAPAKGGSGKPPGTQFITGPCGGDGDCASGCCGFRTGLCAGAIIALQRDGGCGHGNATPNDNAARAMGFTGGITS